MPVLQVVSPVHNLRHLRVVVVRGARLILKSTNQKPGRLYLTNQKPPHLVILAPGCEECEGVPGAVRGLPPAGHQLLVIEHLRGVDHDVSVAPGVTILQVWIRLHPSS